jgi:hypothetical protein
MEYESREHACGFDPSQLYSDEGPPIGKVAAELWTEAALVVAVWRSGCCAGADKSGDGGWVFDRRSR